MTSNNIHAVEDIEKMRASLKLDGWLDSGFLPPNWRYKKTGEQTEENGTFKYYNHKFCADDGRLISNIEDARIVLKNDVVQLEGLDMFWSFESKKKADGNLTCYLARKDEMGECRLDAVGSSQIFFPTQNLGKAY